MAQAYDFSGRPPGAAAIVARGVRVVLRYIGLGSESKQISRAEWQDYLDHGVLVLLVAELGVNDAWEGFDDYALGAARARIALADIDATAPPSVDRSHVFVACAADAHASSATQIQDAVRYSQGFASVVGLWRSGFYGFSETSRAVHAAGAAGWHWRCGSEPPRVEQEWLHFWQRNTPPQVVVINGTACDVNEIYRLPNLIGDDMPTPEEFWLHRIEDPHVPDPDNPGHGMPNAAKDVLYEANGAAWRAEALARQALDELAELKARLAELQARGIGGVSAAELKEILGLIRIVPGSSPG